MIISPDNHLYDGDSYVWSPERAAAAWDACYQQLRDVINTGDIHEVICLIGLPGAGKSTWLGQRVLQDPRVVYFDATLTSSPRRREMVQVIRSCTKPVMVTAVWIDTPFEICRVRNDHRTPDRKVPEARMHEMHWNLLDNPPSPSEGWDMVRKISS